MKKIIALTIASVMLTQTAIASSPPIYPATAEANSRAISEFVTAQSQTITDIIAEGQTPESEQKAKQLLEEMNKFSPEMRLSLIKETINRLNDIEKNLMASPSVDITSNMYGYAIGTLLAGSFNLAIMTAVFKSQGISIVNRASVGFSAGIIALSMSFVGAGLLTKDITQKNIDDVKATAKKLAAQLLQLKTATENQINAAAIIN